MYSRQAPNRKSLFPNLNLQICMMYDNYMYDKPCSAERGQEPNTLSYNISSYLTYGLILLSIGLTPTHVTPVIGGKHC